MIKETVKISAVSFAFLLLAHPVFAAPTGPVASERWGIGFEYNILNDRDLDSDSTTFQEFEVTNSDQFYGIGSVRMYQDRKVKVNVYAKLGSANLSTTALTTNGTSESIDYDYGLLWGIGGNYIYEIDPTMHFVLDMQYVSFSPEFDKVVFNGSTGISPIASDPDVQEYQISMILRKEVGAFNLEGSPVRIIPYGGVDFSWFDIDSGAIGYRDSNGNARGSETGGDGDDVFGVVLGTEFLTLNNALRLRVDGRLVNEEAIALSGEVLF